jgi:hypothetical protein
VKIDRATMPDLYFAKYKPPHTLRVSRVCGEVAATVSVPHKKVATARGRTRVWIVYPRLDHRLYTRMGCAIADDPRTAAILAQCVLAPFSDRERLMPSVA